MEEREEFRGADRAHAHPQVFSLGVVRPTGTTRGRGVFAPRVIRAGEVVEVCPVVLVPGPFKNLPPEIQRITFPWGVMSGDGSDHAIAYGYGGIYNHANPANLRYAALVDIGCLQFTAARTILESEELTINFNSLTGDIATDHDVWFQTLGIAPP